MKINKNTIALTITLCLVVSSAVASIEAKPTHIGANWDNTKHYVERKVKYNLIDKIRAKSHIESGESTWYCCFRPGTKTADGSRYDKHRLTAAHKTLPFGSLVKVTNTKNGKSVIVEITDRGPFKKSTIIDLTPEAFNKISKLKLGVANVKIKVVGFRY